MRKHKRTEAKPAVAVKSHKVTPGEVGAIAGEIAGGLFGSAAGPVGAVAGMVLGAVAGTAAGEALESTAERTRRHDEDLDEAIGVIGGDLGAASPDAPPARIGAPSAASVGVGTPHGSAPSEGPIQSIDED
jgi:hypothetical protein